MVTANCSGGVITLTSQRVLTEEQSKKVQQNIKAIKSICKDLHVNHCLDAEKHVSYIGINYDTDVNLEESLKVLNAAHDHLLAEIDDIVEEHLPNEATKEEMLDELRKHLENGSAVFVLPQRIGRDVEKLTKFAIIVEGILSMIDPDDEEHEDIKADQPE